MHRGVGSTTCRTTSPILSSLPGHRIAESVEDEVGSEAGRVHARALKLPGELGKSAGGEQVHRPEVHEAAAWPGSGHIGDHLLAGNGTGHPVRHQPLLLGQPAV